MNNKVWISPTMKSQLRILESGETNGGDRLRIEFLNDPEDIGPPVHLHPLQEETFTVMEGQLAVKVDGVEQLLSPGDAITVPKNTPHTYWNPASDPVRFISEHRPALGFERFITSIYDLDFDGRANAKGVPAPLQLMVMMRARPGEEFLAGPPRFVQRIGTSLLGGLGRLLGYQPKYVSEKRATSTAATGPV